MENWILMSDKKPSNREDVLVTYEWPDGTRETKFDTWYSDMSGKENYGFGLWTQMAIAWMPLPEPYTKEKIK